MISMILVMSVILFACGNDTGSNGSSEGTSGENGEYNVVATTTIVGNIVEELSGDNINVETLMEPGVDPHLYNASAGDVNIMSDADMVIYNGLHLEGKMGDVFDNMKDQGKLIFTVTEDIDESNFLDNEESPEFYDPHVWFDVNLWEEAATRIAKGLKELDEENAEAYDQNLANYLEELDELDSYIKERIEEVPEEARV